MVEVVNIKATELEVDEDNIRSESPIRDTDKEFIEMVLDIQMKGIQDPLHVKPLSNGKFGVYEGKTRFIAGTQAGLQEFPCIIHHDITSKAAKLQSWGANKIRRHQTFYEDIIGIKKISTEYSHSPIDIDEMAHDLHRGSTWIKDMLNISNLPEGSLIFSKEIGEVKSEEIQKIMSKIPRNPFVPNNPALRKELFYRLGEIYSLTDQYSRRLCSEEQIVQLTEFLILRKITDGNFLWRCRKLIKDGVYNTPEEAWDSFYSLPSKRLRKLYIPINLDRKYEDIALKEKRDVEEIMLEKLAS